MHQRGDEFRRLANRQQGIFLIGVDSPIGAFVAEKAIRDFIAKNDYSHVDGIYIGGFASAGIHGWPDMEIFKGKEMYDWVRAITRVTTLPTIADADTGYGGIHDVRRTVYEYCKVAEVSGFHLEDQEIPKRCGHIAGKRVLPRKESVGKIRAAVDMKNEIDQSLVVIARTDAYNAAGFKETPGFDGDMEEIVARAKEFFEAGADYVWAEFPNKGKKNIEAFARSLENYISSERCGIAAFNYSSSFPWDEEVSEQCADRAKMAQIGVKVLFNTYQMLAEKMARDYDMVMDFCKNPDPGKVLKERMAATVDHPMRSVKKALRVDEDFQRIETKYSALAKENIEKSKGFKAGDKETI